jgi:hypothetical protein
VCRDVSQILGTADAEGGSPPPLADGAVFGPKGDSFSNSIASSNTNCMAADSSSSSPPSESSVAERLDRAALERKPRSGSSGKHRFGWTAEHDGRLWSAHAGHDLISDQIRTLAEQDRPFQPYSAALCNLLDETPLLTPAALASGDQLSPLQQVRAAETLRTADVDVLSDSLQTSTVEYGQGL